MRETILAKLSIFGDRLSGNCYKVSLICALLDIDYQWVDIDLLSGDSRYAELVRKNPTGKIPFIILEDGRVLSESNAIINYLATGSYLYPDAIKENERFELAKIQQWQFFEQYSHEPYIAVARFIAKYLGLPKERQKEYESKQEKGQKALSIMDKQLSQSKYLAGEKMRTCDISLFAYTHVANEGGFSLDNYPNIERWIVDVQSQPSFIPIG